jgi:putative DNA primase/helicase
MARARRELKPKSVPAIVPIALKLKAAGYDPIPLRHKTGPYEGWRLAPNTPADIAAFHGKALALRMSGHDDLFAIDLDIQRQEILDQIWERYQARWPEFMARCVVRHSSRVKVMLIGRLKTDKNHMYSARYGEEPGGNRVELFTANDKRYIVVWGLHSEERYYGYDGPELHEVAYADLPWFLDCDLNELLAIAIAVMEEAGLPLVGAGGVDVDDVLFDLEHDKVAELKDGRSMTLEELADEVVGEFVYVHGRLFDPTSDSYRIKAKITSMGLTLWDFGTGITHYWKERGSQPAVLTPLLKQLVQDVAERTVPPVFGRAKPPPPPGAPAPVMLPGAITQHGTALVFADRWAETMQFCHDTGKWYDWNDIYWKPETTKLAFHRSRMICETVSANSGRAEFKEVRKRSFIGAVEGIAQTDRRIATTAKRWDQDPFLLGTPEGTLDLRTGLLRAADAVDGITRLTASAPQSGSLCAIWRRFLQETFKGDQALIRFTQQWFGYCLTGDVREHALWFGFGEGGNGKGVLMNTFSGVMGDYAVTAAMDTFVASKHDRHLTELAMLNGARLVTASETEKGRAWAESRIKQLTGGDPITARFMRQDNFTFMPQFKLSLIGNHKPVLRGVDDAVRRRFKLVPFLFKPAVVDKELGEKLKAEWPGILWWMVEGCLDWQRNGLLVPESVKLATENYFEDQDLVGQWLLDSCDVRPGTNIFEPTAALFVSWKHFAEQAGEWPGNRKTFVTELMRRGFEHFRQGHDNIRSLRGIKLKGTKIAKAILSIVPSDLSDDTKKEE